jgi:hypothetical protein
LWILTGEAGQRVGVNTKEQESADLAYRVSVVVGINLRPVESD